ncbi:hypothetical protein, partial [Deinococcus navajonensis]
MGDPFGQQPVDQSDGFRGHPVPDRLQRELVTTDAAQIALLPRMGLAVFDDADGAVLRTLQTVDALLNTRHAQKSTTSQRI